MTGLSTTEKPLILATFNNSFYNHIEWLKENKIYLHHLPVLLLSKLKNEADFAVINKLLPYNDGIWINKISRLAQSQNKKHWQWDWGLETSPLSSKIIISNLAQVLK